MRIKLYVIAISLVILVGLIGYFAYDAATMRITGTNPQQNQTGSTANDISISYNHKLDASAKNNMVVSPYTPGTTRVVGNTLIFHPSRTLEINTQYSVSVKNIISQNGKRAKDFTLSFKAIYVPFSKTSNSDQKAGIDNSSSLEKKYPVVHYLPHETSHYKVDYQINPANNLIIYVHLYAVLNNANQMPTYLANLKQYQSEAITYMKSIGLDTTKQEIHYSPNPNSGNDEPSPTPNYSTD